MILSQDWIGMNQSIGLAVREFAKGPEDSRSIPGQVTPKTQKMVCDAF